MLLLNDNGPVPEGIHNVALIRNINTINID